MANLNMFEYIQKVGKGGFGAVFLTRKLCGHDKGALYAIKTIDKKKLLNERKQFALNEQETLRTLGSCPFVTKLYYTFQDADNLYFVMEYVGGGTLSGIMKKHKLTENDVRLYTAELTIAIEALHSRNIVHRDLKPANILITLDGHIKLADFGLSKVLTSRTAKEICGSMKYMAPEMLSKQGYGLEVDWWGLGVIVYVLLTGVNPFDSKEGLLAIRRNILRNEISLSSEFSTPVRHLVHSLLQKLPNARLGAELGAEEIKRHPFFDKIDWSIVAARSYQPGIIPDVDWDPTKSAMVPPVQVVPKVTLVENFIQGFGYSLFV